MVAFTFADNTIRRGWDDSSMAMQPIAPPSKQDMSPEALEAAANCQSSFMYSRTRFPPPMAHREYVFARRVWYKADDGGCYCISKACLHPAPPQPGCRTVRVEDYSAGFVIRYGMVDIRYSMVEQIEMSYICDSQLSARLLINL